jgi:hypothetical protein
MNTSNDCGDRIVGVKQIEEMVIRVRVNEHPNQNIVILPVIPMAKNVSSCIATWSHFVEVNAVNTLYHVLEKCLTGVGDVALLKQLRMDIVLGIMIHNFLSLLNLSSFE